MMKPAIQIANDGRAISFPYTLKDAFRAEFPSAKWNPTQKLWEVGPRSKSRLAAWAAEANETATAALIAEERDFTEAELAATRRQMDEINQRFSESRRSLHELEEVKNRLLATKADFERAIKEAESTAVQVLEHENAINDLLFSLMDKKAIDAAIACMSNNMNPRLGTAKTKFLDAQEVIRAERMKLANAGWSCAAIDFLADANFNRPDRDHPQYNRAKDWFNLKPIAK